jgi:PAS domain S-box-containing protein
MKNDRKIKPEIKKPSANKNEKVKIDEMQKLIHLLQVNQIELEHQTQELRIIQNELEVSRNNYVQFFDFSPIPYLSLDINCIIKEVNLKAGTLFGEGRSKLINRNIISHVAPDDQNRFRAFIQSVFNTDAQQTCELRIINKNNKIFTVKLEAILLKDSLDSNQKCLLALIVST